MRRYGILLMALVLAVTSLIASAAMTSTSLLGALALSTDGSEVVLQVTPQAGHIGNPYGWDEGYLGPGNADGNAELIGDDLVFDFSKGFIAGLGMQPNSAYTWNSLFMVRNILRRSVDCTVWAEFDSLPAGIDILIKDSHGTDWVPMGTKVRKLLASRVDTDADELYVDVKIALGEAVSLGSISGSIIVSGVYADPPEPPDPPEPDAKGTITVNVLKADGASVSGLPVTFTGGINLVALTDDSGSVTLSDLDFGTYTVNVSVEGYTSDGPVTIELTTDSSPAIALINLVPAQSPPGPPEPPYGPIIGPPIPPGGELPKTGVAGVLSVVAGVGLIAAGRAVQRRRRRRRDSYSGRLLGR